MAGGLQPAYDALQGQVKLLLTTYFEGAKRQSRDHCCATGPGLHVDLVHGKDDVAEPGNKSPAGQDWLPSAADHGRTTRRRISPKVCAN